MTVLRRYGPLLAVAALLGAATIAAALATPQITRVPPISHSPRPAPQATGTAPIPTAAINDVAGTVPRGFEVPGWLAGLVSALCLGLVALLIGVLVWQLLRGRLSGRVRRFLVEKQPPVPLAPTRDEVLAAVDAGLSGLTDDADPRRAVIACWVRLEQVAAAAGTPREAGDSPTDLVLRLLAAHRIDDRALYPFAEVYRRARYASHAVDVGMRDAARAALARVRDDLTAGVG